jgi:trehalose/maltose hydrolase-like predicted phosphorylase
MVVFDEALDSGLADLQRRTTREGIHLGAIAGTVDRLLRCNTGLETRMDNSGFTQRFCLSWASSAFASAID